jgi:copper homeostasis protein (lipoprotein)
MNQSVRVLAVCWLAVAGLLASACGRAPSDAGMAPGAAPGSATPGSAGPETSERTWVGLLPCSDCLGIDTRLVLRADGGRRSYLMVENYLGGSGENSFKRAGSWTEQTAIVAGEPVTLYVLDPEQPGQRFALQADGALELLDPGRREPAQAVAYRLQRQ